MQQFALAIEGFENPTPPKMPAPAGPWTKRAYQLSAVENAFENLKTHRSTLLVMATGTGKTRTAGMGLIRKWLEDGRGEVLWLAHLDTLIEQTRTELETFLAEEIGLCQGPFHWGKQRACIGSVATLYRKSRLDAICKRPTLIVYDEAHHSLTAANKRIVDAMPNAKLVGLTATPWRLDGLGLKNLYESISIEYKIGTAIDDGYLVPVLVDVATIKGLNFDHLSRREFSDENIGKVIGEDEVLRGICESFLKKIGKRRAAIFFPTVNVAHLAADLFNELVPGIATAIDGTRMEKDEKKQRIRDFKKDKYQIVCNVGVLAEGYDDPGISAIGLAALTDSLSRYLQQMGRGTRNVCKVDAFETASERKKAIALSEKPNLLVVDFVGNSKRHDPVTALDTLAGEDIDAEIVKRAKKIAKTAGQAAPEEVFAKAKSEIAAEKAAELERLKAAKAVEFEFKRIDVFKSFGFNREKEDVISDALDRPSVEQLRRLSFLGIEGEKVNKISSKEASRLEGIAKMRKARNLATFKQCAQLTRVGISGQQMYKSTAIALIDYMMSDARKNNRNQWNWTHPGDTVIKAIITANKERNRPQQ